MDLVIALIGSVSKLCVHVGIVHIQKKVITRKRDYGFRSKSNILLFN